MLRVKVYHVFIGAMTFPHVLVFAYNYLGNGRLTTISLKVAASILYIYLKLISLKSMIFFVT